MCHWSKVESLESHWRVTRAILYWKTEEIGDQCPNDDNKGHIYSWRLELLIMGTFLSFIFSSSREQAYCLLPSTSGVFFFFFSVFCWPTYLSSTGTLGAVLCFTNLIDISSLNQVDIWLMVTSSKIISSLLKSEEWILTEIHLASMNSQDFNAVLNFKLFSSLFNFNSLENQRKTWGLISKPVSF